MKPTRWHVITGAPCSGKTSVIERLERLGFRVVHEVARAYIDSELAKGKTLEEIRSDELAFESRILKEKCAIEASLPPGEILFLDRAIPDSMAYFELGGLEASLPREKSRMFRYKTIFLFDRLHFEKDPVRAEDQEEAAALQSALEKAYSLLQYPIVRVPPLSIQQRTDFILNTCGLSFPQPD
jgi:predicted ATPase